MSAMGDFHYELSNAGIDPRTYEFDQVRGTGYISTHNIVPTAAITANQQAGFSAPSQESERPAFFVSSPGAALMPTRRDIPHTEPDTHADGAVAALERASVWVMWVCVVYLSVRAFIPFLWHLFTDGGH
jgi:hypothetical protein